MPQPWIIKPPAQPSPDLLAVVGGHPLVAQLLAQRGIDTPAAAQAFLDPDRYIPAPPQALVGVDVAAHQLLDALRGGDNILVWGDFDVDGQTSTALLVTALRMLATTGQVHFHVPNRFTESHGVKVDKLAALLAGSAVPLHLLVSCDTGITDGAAVGFAKDRGLRVVITDHHDLPAELSVLRPGVDALWGQDADAAGLQSVRRADAIVNPKFLPPGDPLRTLPGVGVAYKLIQRVFELAGRSGAEAELLDLVALGIVADVAEQVHDARYLLQRGLERLRVTRRTGLLALMNTSRIDPASLTAESIGFQLGPRMNALGRLEDATVAIELLTTQDAIRAGQLAGKLERLNQERQLLTRQITNAALEMLDRQPQLLEHSALVLAHPNWHAGVVGIVASKLVERFGRPTVLLLNPPGEAARGSARTAPGVDIGASIAACSSLLLTYGGHPGAAGVSLLPENIDAFRRALSRQVDLHRDAAVEIGLVVDAALAPGELNMGLAEELARLAPFGQGNPMPQFVSYALEVVEDRRMGREGIHRRLTVQPAGRPDGPRHGVVWFHGADVELPPGPIDLVYTLGINEYKGQRTLQLSYVDSRPAQPVEPIRVTAPARLPRRVVDWRRQPAPPGQLPGREAAAWYAEGPELDAAAAGVAYCPRWQIDPSQRGRPLVIWSAPPDAGVLRWLLETVQPAEVYLCDQVNHSDDWLGVLKPMASMCKFALGRDGQVDIRRMAARLGATEAVAHLSLLWLAARGDLAIDAWQQGDVVRIAAGSHVPDERRMQELLEELKDHLLEIRAYRRFYQRAQVGELGIDV